MDKVFHSQLLKDLALLISKIANLKQRITRKTIKDDLLILKIPIESNLKVTRDVMTCCKLFYIKQI